MNRPFTNVLFGAFGQVKSTAAVDETKVYKSETGMPIIDADKARTVIAIKRSKNPGFAGIENDLYFTDHTWMLFGDAKAVVGELVKQLAADSGARQPQAA